MRCAIALGTSTCARRWGGWVDSQLRKFYRRSLETGIACDEHINHAVPVQWLRHGMFEAVLHEVAEVWPDESPGESIVVLSASKTRIQLLLQNDEPVRGGSRYVRRMDFARDARERRKRVGDGVNLMAVVIGFDMIECERLRR